MIVIKRESGVLMPISSLPSPYGIGTLGAAAYEFADFLKAAGQKYWQLLPIGPTGYGDSPYSSFSSFAGNPYYIDLDMLCDEGLIDRDEINSLYWGENPEKTDYGAVYYYRFSDTVLKEAFRRGREKLADEIIAFRAENSAWVESYALYMSLKESFDMKCWIDWPDEDIRMHKAEAVKKYSVELADRIEFWIFLQFLFFRQWNALRDYVHSCGISFIGDVPIYVAMDSVDIWANPELFQLDENNLPVLVAGCPPDAFTEDGQLWGNPLYDWDRMKQEGYGWWIRRIDGVGKIYDVIRIDHFRGFESYWAVPYGDTTAKNGSWKPGPGMDLVGVLKNWFHNLSFIAEDLGFITPEVGKLLDDSGFPGMDVLEFAFDTEGDSAYMPHNCKTNSVCYIGTHDNEPVLGWLESTSKEIIDYCNEYVRISPDEGWCWGLIRAGMSCPACLFVAQMQDLLELTSAARMNTPGTSQGNWTWRMKPDALTPALAEKLRRYTEVYRRL